MLTLCPHQVLWFSTSEVAGQWYEPGKYGLFQEYLFAYGAEGTEGIIPEEPPEALGARSGGCMPHHSVRSRW